MLVGDVVLQIGKLGQSDGISLKKIRSEENLYENISKPSGNMASGRWSAGDQVYYLVFLSLREEKETVDNEI